VPELEVEDLRVHVHEWLPSDASEARAGVVCLPSTGMAGSQWRKLAKALSGRGHRVLAPDLLGYGDSVWPGTRRFETRDDVAVVTATLALAGPDPLHLVAHSYGGRVGLLAACEQPERIRSIALFEPTCFGVLRSAGEHEAIRELLDYDVDGRFLDERFGGSEAWIERFVDYWSGAGSFAEFSPREREVWLRAGRKMFEEVRETSLDAVPHQRYLERLADVPMLTMSGAESTRAGRRCAAVLAEQLPHCRHVELPGVGHMAPLLAAAEVNALILAHVAAS
jgi:pimeloyl-ACP methyl ester carboxylesterase